MKLLKEFTSISDAEVLVEKLRKKGVLTHISSTNSNQLGGHATGAIKVGVWVVVSEQFNDAVAYLTNHKHMVSNPLSETEMDLIEAKAKEQMNKSINNVLNKLAITFISIIFIVLAFYVLSNS